MNKNLFLFFLNIFFASVYFNSNAQTKKETEEWIKNKIETYAYSDASDTEEYNVSFENCTLIVKSRLHVFKVLLKDLEIIIDEYPERDESSQLYLPKAILQFHSSICYTSFDSIFWPGQIELIYFKKEFLYDNLEVKMVKYFSHLIVFCGGNPLEEDKGYVNSHSKAWIQKLPGKSPSSNKNAYVPRKESNKSPSSNIDDVIHMQKMESGLYEIPVMINDVLKISFIFDSGASDVSISPDVAATLMRTGTVKETDFIGSQKYSFGDGSTAINKRFIIRKLSIGNHVVTNVTATISNSINAPMLLGQSVQQKFGKITIDNTNHTIAFGK